MTLMMFMFWWLQQTLKGSPPGPPHTLRQTAFNEIENDLEVVEFTLTDGQQRNPQRLVKPSMAIPSERKPTDACNRCCTFPRVAQSYIGEHEANVRIDAVAVPPINISGGPHEWPGEPVEWSSSWFAEVDVNGDSRLNLRPLL